MVWVLPIFALFVVLLSACSPPTQTLRAPFVQNPASIRSMDLYKNLDHVSFASIDHVSFASIDAEYSNSGTDEFHHVPVGDYLAHQLVRKFNDEGLKTVTLSSFAMKCQSEGGLLPHAICAGSIRIDTTTASDENESYISSIYGLDVGPVYAANSAAIGDVIANQVRAALDSILLDLERVDG